MRLFIFLAIFLSFAASELAADEMIIVSGWLVGKVGDDFSGDQKVAITKISGEKSSTVSFGCVNNNRFISISPGADFEDDSFMFGSEIRVDGGNTLVTGFISSKKNGEKVLVASPPDELFDELKKGNNVAFRIYKSSGYFDASFPLSGIGDALPYVEKACPDISKK